MVFFFFNLTIFLLVYVNFKLDKIKKTHFDEVQLKLLLNSQVNFCVGAVYLGAETEVFQAPAWPVANSVLALRVPSSAV